MPVRVSKKLPPFRRPSRNRSENMKAIRSGGNRTTERRLVSLLANGRIEGWRIRPRNVLGKPDFVFRRKRVAVFVDGCFWHGCPHCGHIPKTNKVYWRAKISKNKRRDRYISRALRNKGYSVVRLRECDLRLRPAASLMRIRRVLQKARARS